MKTEQDFAVKARMESIGLYSQVLVKIKGKAALKFQQAACANAPEFVSFSVPLQTWKSQTTGWTQHCLGKRRGGGKPSSPAQQGEGSSWPLLSPASSTYLACHLHVLLSICLLLLQLFFCILQLLHHVIHFPGQSCHISKGLVGFGSGSSSTLQPTRGRRWKKVVKVENFLQSFSPKCTDFPYCHILHSQWGIQQRAPGAHQEML